MAAKELPKEFDYQRFLKAAEATQNRLLDSFENMSEEDKLLYDADFGEGAWEEDFGNGN